MQAKSHLVLMVGHIGIDDIPSSKIYEYIGLNKKVLICPSDNGVIENTLTNVGLALSVNTAEEAYSMMEQELLNMNNLAALNIDQSKTYKYSRRAQTNLLCNLLDKV